ncbi:hypothetical protein HK102_003026, partial [Quaeritorhiza haematococci]
MANHNNKRGSVISVLLSILTAMDREDEGQEDLRSANSDDTPPPLSSTSDEEGEISRAPSLNLPQLQRQESLKCSTPLEESVTAHFIEELYSVDGDDIPRNSFRERMDRIRPPSLFVPRRKTQDAETSLMRDFFAVSKKLTQTSPSSLFDIPATYNHPRWQSTNPKSNPKSEKPKTTGNKDTNRRSLTKVR